MHLPPTVLATLELRLVRKRIERQSFDPIEMRYFWPGGKTGGARRAAAVTRPVLLEARKGGAGAADMLVEEIAVGAAADDLLDWLVRRRRGEPLRHDRGHRAARPGQGCRQMRKGPLQAKFHGAVVGRRQFLRRRHQRGRKGDARRKAADAGDDIARQYRLLVVKA